jgi:hypothetical protein
MVMPTLIETATLRCALVLGPLIADNPVNGSEEEVLWRRRAMIS